ncbi:MAG: thiamine ABC transporter substrate-binding protein, partial [Acidimicrobiia bacterium]|nr:thiamine ABC transporter substrate-binding protein [Acidimicrobiia bacterium]
MTARSRFPQLLLVVIALLLGATACSERIVEEDTQPSELVLMTHDSFALSEGTLEAFTEETG